MKKIFYIVSILFFVLFMPLYVSAETTSGFATGADMGAGTVVISGGPNKNHTGYLAYLIDENFNQITTTKVFYCGNEKLHYV